jgi:hypothetical protein
MQQQQKLSHHHPQQPLYQSHEYTARELIRCKDWIEKALKRSGETSNIESVFNGIIKGESQLWSSENACLVTQILNYPTKKVLFLFIAAGKLEEILSFTDSVTDWAKKQGCVEAEFNGRLGWIPALKKHNWKTRTVTMVKEI